MPIYTFITDFQSGTYVCQKEAEDLRAACFLWKDDIRTGGYVPKLNAKAFAKAFDADIDELPPMPLDNMLNVWSFSLLIGDDLLSLNIIQTSVSILAETIPAVRA